MPTEADRHEDSPNPGLGGGKARPCPASLTGRGPRHRGGRIGAPDCRVHVRADDARARPAGVVHLHGHVRQPAVHDQLAMVPDRRQSPGHRDGVGPEHHVHLPGRRHVQRRRGDHQLRLDARVCDRDPQPDRPGHLPGLRPSGAVQRVERCGRQERKHRRLPDGIRDHRTGLLRVHGHRGHLRRPDRAQQGHRLGLDRRIADQARGPLLAPRRHHLVAGDGADGRRPPDPGQADRHQEPRLDRHAG